MTELAELATTEAAEAFAAYGHLGEFEALFQVSKRRQRLIVEARSSPNPPPIPGPTIVSTAATAETK